MDKPTEWKETQLCRAHTLHLPTAALSSTPAPRGRRAQVGQALLESWCPVTALGAVATAVQYYPDPWGGGGAEHRNAGRPGWRVEQAPTLGGGGPWTLPLGSQLHPRAASPWRGCCDAQQQSANKAYCRASSSTRQSGSSPDKRLRGAPAPRVRDRNQRPWWCLNRAVPPAPR